MTNEQYDRAAKSDNVLATVDGADSLIDGRISLILSDGQIWARYTMAGEQRLDSLEAAGSEPLDTIERMYGGADWDLQPADSKMKYWTAANGQSDLGSWPVGTSDAAIMDELLGQCGTDGEREGIRAGQIETR